MIPSICISYSLDVPILTVSPNVAVLVVRIRFYVTWYLAEAPLTIF